MRRLRNVKSQRNIKDKLTLSRGLECEILRNRSLFVNDEIEV